MSVNAKQWFESKTIWLGVFTIAISTLTLTQVFIQSGDFTLYGFIGLVIGVLQIVVRFMTGQPIK